MPLASEGIYFIKQNRTNETRPIYKNVYYDTYIKWSEPKQQENILTYIIIALKLFELHCQMHHFDQLVEINHNGICQNIFMLLVDYLRPELL